MNAGDRWRRVQELFLAVGGLPPDQRGAFLREACGDDIGLRQEAESLLARDHAESPVIASIVEGAAAAYVGQQTDVAFEKHIALRIRHGIPEEGRFVPGTLIAGRYRIIALLGRGGMGEVYRATDLTLAQSVALKFLPEEAARDQRLLERFHGEVRVARQVSHPNVCRVYDIGEVKGAPFLSMEYVDGEDLASLLLRIGRLPADKALDTARRICAGLGAAHDRGIMHRDLKPANIMINKRGDVVIMDFGLAAIASQLAGPEARNGTPAYMAPERLKGTEVTARSDIYALGLVLYELFTGKRPFEGTTIEKLLEQQEAMQWPSMSSISSDIDPVVERAIRLCLDPDASKRPASALAVAAALPGGDPLAAALAAGETPSPEAVAASGKTEGLALKYSVPCLAALVLCLAVWPAIRQQSDSFLQAPSDFSPPVLAQKARDIAASFGYPSKPADSALWLGYRRDLLLYLNALPKPWAWPGLFAAESPIAAEYRESPSLLIARPLGEVNRYNPQPDEPGMARVVLDGNGRLREFSAVPYEDTPLPEVSAELIFRAAGLDFAKFTDLSPAGMPRAPTDTARSWKGPHPGLPHTQVTVDIGWAREHVTWTKVRFPWDVPPAAQASSLANFVGQAASYFLAAGFVFAAILARRNWKLGRADRKGALRVGGACIVLELVDSLRVLHAVPDSSMLSLMLAVLEDGLFWAATLALVYLALEPALRSRWPHSIVTWNRLLAGRWKDPQAGAHILIGATVGMVLTVSTEQLQIWFGDRMSRPPTDGVLNAALGAREWFGTEMDTLGNALLGGLEIFFSVFCLRLLVRKNIVAVVLAALVWMLVILRHIDPSHWLVVAPLYFALAGSLIFVLVRLGLVAATAALYFMNGSTILLGTNWNTWYAPYGLASLTLLLAVGLYAFWLSLGGRDLFAHDGHAAAL